MKLRPTDRAKLLDLRGRTFGRLIAVRRSRKRVFKCRRVAWLCLCTCGKTVLVATGDLTKGNTRSCGCLEHEINVNRFYRHGLSGTLIYAIWRAMINRCFVNTDKGWKNYGGRGITVHRRWWKFENFFADMGHRPAGKTLERINNNKGYSPANCKWATYREQALNRRPKTRKATV